jgi:hypothetical protein
MHGMHAVHVSVHCRTCSRLDHGQAETRPVSGDSVSHRQLLPGYPLAFGDDSRGWLGLDVTTNVAAGGVSKSSTWDCFGTCGRWQHWWLLAGMPCLSGRTDGGC